MTEEQQRKISIRLPEATWCGLLCVMSHACEFYAANRDEDQLGLDVCYEVATKIFKRVLSSMEESEAREVFFSAFDEIMETDPDWNRIKEELEKRSGKE